MHQSGGLQRLAGLLVPETRPRHAAKFGVDKRNQTVERRPVAILPGVQQCRYGGVAHNGNSLAPVFFRAGANFLREARIRVRRRR